ncbi:MAG: SUF system Fe-S cluster assembly regulator [Alphaproteobacteria bacterium]|nr:SUF system Fe-S cluster assembly regulator [Alphaproteobacteria bacterium]
MIKLGKLTDYAIAVMVQLSKEGSDAARSAHQLANKTGIPEPTVAKVLKKLTGGKLLESVRGAAGGYRLARDASSLSLCEVIEAMDGPITIVSCVDGVEEACKAEETCPTRGRWDPVNDAIRGALQKITLTEMAAGACRAPYNFIQQEPLQPAAQGEKAG